jgi:hypothetical protein
LVIVLVSFQRLAPPNHDNLYNIYNNNHLTIQDDSKVYAATRETVYVDLFNVSGYTVILILIPFEKIISYSGKVYLWSVISGWSLGGGKLTPPLPLMTMVLHWQAPVKYKLVYLYRRTHKMNTKIRKIFGKISWLIRVELTQLSEKLSKKKKLNWVKKYIFFIYKIEENLNNDIILFF